jgi:hypothetical protein
MMDWAGKWGMEFNRQKCKVMHFGANNPKHQYSMGGQVLAETEEEKDVGVTVTKNLKPGAHCSKAAKTASVVLGQIGRSFKYRDKKIFPKLYTRYVRPHLEFVSVAWNPWHQKDIDVPVLERVQKRAVNMINGLAGKTYEEKLSEIGLETLSERRKEADLVQFFKVMKGHSTVNRQDWFETAARTTNVTRMAADELCIKKHLPARTKDKTFLQCEFVICGMGCPRIYGQPKMLLILSVITGPM